MKRRLKIAALIFGLLLPGLLAFLAWVLYTEAGLRFAVARLPERMGKVTLRIEGRPRHDRRRFRRRPRRHRSANASHVRVEKGSARVNLLAAAGGAHLGARRAAPTSCRSRSSAGCTRHPNTPPKFLPRFLSISAETARSRMLVIIAPNGRRVEFNDVTGSGIVGHKTIRIFDSNVIYGVLQARSIGELRAADPIKLSGETTTRMIIEGQPNWRADSSFDGTLDKLPLTLKLFEPFRADMRGELLSLSNDFHWTGKADVHNFDLQAFGGGSALGIITGPLDVGGEMNAFHARGPLMVPGLGSGPFDLVFEGNYADHVVNATHYEVTHQATGSHVDGQGTIEPAENGPKLLLHGDWRGLRWPLAARFTAETPQIFSQPRRQVPPRRALAVRHHRQRRSVRSAARSHDGRGARRAAQGSPADRRARARRVRRQGADLAGEARWSPEESWSLAGSVKGINPGELRPGFNGALDFNMKASGAPFGGDGTLDFAFSDLSGKLRGNTATGSGRVMLAGRELDLRQAALSRRQHAAGHRRRTRRIARAQSRFQPRRRQPRAAGRRRARRAARQRSSRRHLGGAGHQAHGARQRNRARHAERRQTRRQRRRRLARPAHFARGHRHLAT